MRHTPQIASIDWLVRRPIAHRGLHDFGDGVPENTKTAFNWAIDSGYAIECDVQLSADGEAMVFHDVTLDRLTEANGHLGQMTVRQLKSVAFKVGNDRMQTLPNLLAQVQGRVPLIIEVKSNWDGNATLALRTIACLRSYEGPVAVMSFDPDILRILAIQAPDIVRGIVADRVHDPSHGALSVRRRIELRSLSHLAQTKPHFISYDHLGLPFRPVQFIRSQGFPVITWTITSKLEASRALRYADQITFETFRPE